MDSPFLIFVFIGIFAHLIFYIIWFQWLRLKRIRLNAEIGILIRILDKFFYIFTWCVVIFVFLWMILAINGVMKNNYSVASFLPEYTVDDALASFLPGYTVDDASFNENNDSISSKLKWYEGGTLHSNSASIWELASFKDKLATCADFIITLWQYDKLKQSLANDVESIDDLKPLATELVYEIDNFLNIHLKNEKNIKIWQRFNISATAELIINKKGWRK
jgi:hypothetical protein